jgi:predicted HTH domain antitoxin
MSLTIPEETLDGLRHAPRDALIDMACRLYDADRISKPEATKLTGLSRVEFEGELTKRGLPWIRVKWDETYEREFAEIAKGLNKGSSTDPAKES